MTFDLDRLELLRGPQGTSYGAAAESGILRYVLKEPSVSRFEARVGADVSAVHGAAKSGTSIQAVVNAPIVDDRLAVRVNAYDSYTPGYIDNAYTGAKDVNDLRHNGGRIAALWRPSDSLSMKVTAFLDRLSADSSPKYRPPELAPVPNTGDAWVINASRPFGDLKENRAFLQPVEAEHRLLRGDRALERGLDRDWLRHGLVEHATQYSLDATPWQAPISALERRHDPGRSVAVRQGHRPREVH
jgi:outer membrane receptor protein involved in Fe transport